MPLLPASSSPPSFLLLYSLTSPHRRSLHRSGYETPSVRNLDQSSDGRSRIRTSEHSFHLHSRANPPKLPEVSEDPVQENRLRLGLAKYARPPPWQPVPLLSIQFAVCYIHLHKETIMATLVATD